jgi:DNA-binding GntR family transcriptional regulator
VTREGHIEVAEAIRDHDPLAARKAMETMLERNRRTALHHSTPPKAKRLSTAGQRKVL